MMNTHLLFQFIGVIGALVVLVLAWTMIRNRRLDRSLQKQPYLPELKVRVQRITDETADIKSFELVSTSGSLLPVWSAGAHIDVQVDNKTVRQYSLCGVPGARDTYLIAVKKAPDSRGGSKALHQRVSVGDTLVISGPRNHFPLVDKARHYLLLAGGIGVTPIFAMAQELESRGASYELHYFTRSIADTAFRDILTSEPYASKVSIHHTDADRTRELLQSLLAQCPQGHHLYMCGPRGFTDAINNVTSGRWPSETIHVEYFNADLAALATPGRAFEVKLERSGRTIPVAANCSIVDALCAHGVDVATSCREGVCGTCLTGVLAGTPDHRDAYLSDKERKAGDKIMICVSRAKTDQLVLDL